MALAALRGISLPMPFTFHRGAEDPGSRARRGSLVTRHGLVETPVFMPVGTRATVTGLTAEEVRALGAEIILGNTYHLLLRPGPEAMRRFGGLHRFMGWDRSILTDSGGFQIFSLAGDRTITERGARFKSYVDCRFHELTPERSIEVQTALGSDIMMVLDVCLPSTSPPEAIREAMDRTHRWALRSLGARTDPGQALFAIVQGGLSMALRAESAAFLTQHPFDGFAIGGLAVGDTRAERADVIERTTELLPRDRPRYLMGVGTPPDILEAVGRGVDMFDCVIPTTLAWQGTAFTSTGRVRLTRADHRLSDAPLDATCACPTCQAHPRGYLHHLVKCGEPLGPRLVSIHNLHHYLALMRSIRSAIDEGRYAAFARETMDAIDRHEHDTTRRRPGARFEVVVTQSGAAAVRDRDAGEVMHPGVGAAAESEQLYVHQSGLRSRLMQDGPPLVLFDVGLGAGSNALAAVRAARALPGRHRALQVLSFERDTAALAFAVTQEGAARLEYGADDVRAARGLLATGTHEEPGITWRLVAGDARETLAACPELADVVFWDPYSPRRDPRLWTVEAFRAIRARCGPAATLFTYSSATSVRSALLLAGFFVGFGDPCGSKAATTAAAVRRGDVARPLDGRWLERVERSSAALPPDAPPDALDRLRSHPQFACARGGAPSW